MKHRRLAIIIASHESPDDNGFELNCLLYRWF